MDLTVRRHHLKRHATQLAYLKQVFELSPPHHCASERTPERGLLQDETERGCWVFPEDGLPGHAGGHHLLDFVL